MQKLKRLLTLWTSLTPETQESILSRWPLLLALAAGALAACYFGLCACRKAESAEPGRKVCLCSPACVCGCNEGRPCKCEGSTPNRAKQPAKESPKDWRTSGVESKDGSPVTSKKQIVLHSGGGKQHLSPEQARLILSENKTLPDDSRKVHLTVIGSAEKRKQVRDDLAKAPELTRLADRLLVQDYGPEDWPVKDVGFETNKGDPTIVIQSRKGGVLHAQYEYRGPAKLAEAIESALAEAARRKDPDRDPSKDPDLNKSVPGGSIVPTVIDYASKVPTGAWAAGGIGAAILFLGRKKQ